ncbi:hypothetical protein Sjap_000649 [Stephania japonica]|uniref:Secreted protein n=1 Tax=Stephania japonica TaxID=461633 RepID=A0AAP0KK95_9MAGN
MPLLAAVVTAMTTSGAASFAAASAPTSAINPISTTTAVLKPPPPNLYPLPPSYQPQLPTNPHAHHRLHCDPMTAAASIANPIPKPSSRMSLCVIC